PLAWPVMLSRASILMMAFCDIAMLGRYAPGAVGTMGLGMSIFIPLMVFGIGLCTGVVAVVAQAYGAGDWAECGRHWRRGMVWGAAVSLGGMAVCWQAESLLRLMGQSAELADAGGAVARALTPGLGAQVIFAISAYYLEATGRPKIGLVVMIAANLVNFALNWVLIFGALGLPELGAVGAALASTAARIVAAGALVLVILMQPGAARAGVIGRRRRGFWGPGGWAAGRAMRRLGIAAGLSNGFETIGFTAMTQFAGKLGKLPLDAFAIAVNLIAVCFMVGLGLAVATAVRVGIEAGRGRMAEATFAGWTGLGASAVTLGAVGVLLYLGRGTVVGLYTDEPLIAAQTLPLIALLGLVLVPDSAQVVLGQALRALGDAWVPVTAYVLSFVVLMVPLAWWLVLRQGYDERALIGAIFAGCVLASLLLGWRFRALTRGHGRKA
ncbi:MAG TPA: MATE family efflux transporter, partial [Thermohalobaculum sp.]|nr:MATE family efflux transporter [Thermohalobaculum sp.]